MDEQRRHFVRIMEHQTISPSDDSASQSPMGQTVARHPQPYVGREHPEEQEVEDVRVVTQVEQEVVPIALLVLIHAKREKIQCLERIRDVHPPKGGQRKRYSRSEFRYKANERLTLGPSQTSKPRRTQT